MITGKKMLITGGAGFIGTHIAERLAEHNDVTLFDIDLNGAVTYSRLAKDSRVRKVQGDVRNAEAVQEEVSRCQILLHYASILGVRKVIDHARDTIDTVLFGTRNVLEAARHNPKIERIVNISTSEVYGNVMDAREGNELPGQHGQRCPRLLRLEQARRGTHRVGLSSRLQIADGDRPAIQHLWPDAQDRQRRGPLLRPRRREQGRDHDGRRQPATVVVLYRRLLRRHDGLHRGGKGDRRGFQHRQSGHRRYDLRPGCPDHSAGQKQLEADHHGHTFSDIGVRAPSSQKARELLGYEPKFDLDAGLLPTIDWYRQNTE